MALPDLIRAANDASAAVKSIPAPSTEHLRSGGGGGTSDGMGPWEQSVEGRLTALGDKIDSLQRWLLVAFAAGFVALGGLILNRTDVLSDKIGSLGQDVATVKAQMAAPRSAPTSSEVPPCPAGNPGCKPWEREWGPPPPVGTIVPK